MAWAWPNYFRCISYAGTQMKVKVLVLGGMGFVGSNINLSSEDYELYSLDTAPLATTKYQRAIRGDIRDSRVLFTIDEIKPKVLVVLAGKQFERPIQRRSQRIISFSANEEIARRVIEIVRNTPSISQVIYVSTDMVYGRQGLSLIDEKVSPHPIGEYGKSKFAAEEVLKSLEVEWVVFRPRLIVGPGRTGTVELLSKFIRLGMPVPIIGKGNNRYQMLSVFDMWSAIENAISQKLHGVYNLGSDNPETLNVLLPKILESLGKRNPILRLPKSLTERSLLILDQIGVSPLAPEQFLIAGQNCLLDITKMKGTGWSPKFSDEAMLTEALGLLI